MMLPGSSTPAEVAGAGTIRNLDTGELVDVSKIAVPTHTRAVASSSGPPAPMPTAKKKSWPSSLLDAARGRARSRSNVSPPPGALPRVGTPHLGTTRETAHKLIGQAMKCAQDAVKADQAGAYAEALEGYGKASKLIELSLHVGRGNEAASPQLTSNLANYKSAYQERILKLRDLLANESGASTTSTAIPAAATAALGADVDILTESEEREMRERRQRQLRPPHTYHLPKGSPAKRGAPRAERWSEALGRVSQERRRLSDALLAGGSRSHQRRLSHAEAGMRFFEALRESGSYLAACMQEVESARVWRCDPDADGGSGSRAIGLVQAHTRV